MKNAIEVIEKLNSQRKNINETIEKLLESYFKNKYFNDDDTGIQIELIDCIRNLYLMDKKLLKIYENKFKKSEKLSGISADNVDYFDDLAMMNNLSVNDIFDLVRKIIESTENFMNEKRKKNNN